MPKKIHFDLASIEVILRESPVGQLITDAEGKIVYLNKKITKIFGYSEAELLGQPIEMLVPQSIRGHHIQLREKYHQNPHSRSMGADLEIQGVQKKGGMIPLEVGLTPLEIKNQPLVLSAIMDISERKASEEREKKYKSKLMQLQKIESLSVLAGGIAHDFNNLLMGILGHADLAKLETDETSAVASHLDHIIHASQRAADLCREMMAYSGKGHFVKTIVSLNHLISEMARIWEVVLSKNIVLRLHYADQDPFIECDATQIRQVILNLITNASDSIENKSGVVTITTGVMDCDQDYIETVLHDNNIEPGLYCFVEVADTGCGMTQEVIDKMFDPFFTTKLSGKGLGMAAVHGILRGHKGAIKVYSVPGKGTTVKCLFPLCRLANHTGSWIEDSIKTPIYLEGKVLVVDDEKTIRSVCKLMLQKLGIESIFAENGIEALELYHRYKDELALILLDLTMPKMDGGTCFRELRQLDIQVPVIISSGYSEHEIDHKFLNKGVMGFIQKPYTIENLREAILSLKQKSQRTPNP